MIRQLTKSIRSQGEMSACLTGEPVLIDFGYSDSEDNLYASRVTTYGKCALK